MKEVTTYQNKTVIVLGMARSGISAAKLLHRLGAKVLMNDLNEVDENIVQSLTESGIDVVTGYHPVEWIDDNIDYLFKSPGIPYENEMVSAALKRHIPVLTDVELAYEVSEAPIIGITGTNGKTTTTMMIGDLLNEEDPHHAKLAGNIGIPACDVAEEVSSNQVIVMELSSFQLMGVSQFRPKIAVLLNIYEAHLDYHHTREAYKQAKWNIQKNMTSDDYLVINVNEVEWQELAKETKASVIPFATGKRLEKGAYEYEGHLYYDGQYIMDCSELGVPGSHNVENALAAIAVACLNQVPIDQIREGLMNFSGAQHRLQYIGEYNQVKYYNDSKATNILATQKALSGFDHQHLILIAGGLDRGNSFDAIIPDLKGLKGIVLMGETKEKMALAAKAAKVPVIQLVDNMDQAVQQAISLAEPGDSILLSPANASWDQYKTFEQRGDHFVNAVHQQNQ